MRINESRRRDIANFISSFSKSNGREPSIREIGHAVGISSTSTTMGYLRRMTKDGILCMRDDTYSCRYSINSESQYFID